MELYEVTVDHLQKSDIGPRGSRSTGLHPPERDGSPLADVLADLQEMGLTYQESLVYSELVSMGPSHARRISERAHLPREDSYRILRRLESRGLVEVHLSKPSVFVAVEPRAAVRSFVSTLESRSEELKQRAYDLGFRLEKIKGTARNPEEADSSSDSTLRVLTGHQVFVELERALSCCQRTYSCVLAPVSFVSASGAAVLDEILACRRRGVETRLITEFNRDNLDAIRRYSKQLAIRHHPNAGQGIRFSVFDDSKTILALAEPVTARDGARVMSSSIPTLVKGLTFYFEQMWEESRTLVDPWSVRRRSSSGNKPAGVWVSADTPHSNISRRHTIPVPD